MLEGGEIAAQVVPPLPDKEMTTMFISSSSATFAWWREGGLSEN